MPKVMSSCGLSNDRIQYSDDSLSSTYSLEDNRTSLYENYISDVDLGIVSRRYSHIVYNSIARKGFPVIL